MASGVSKLECLVRYIFMVSQRYSAIYKLPKLSSCHPSFLSSIMFLCWINPVQPSSELCLVLTLGVCKPQMLLQHHKSDSDLDFHKNKSPDIHWHIPFLEGILIPELFQLAHSPENTVMCLQLEVFISYIFSCRQKIENLFDLSTQGPSSDALIHTKYVG